MYTEPATPEPSGPLHAPAHVLARKVWAAFAFTFVLSRILVFLIMSGRMPDIHSHFRVTHLHHLNYGIVLLAGVGAVLLFNRPTGRWLAGTAILYGVGLALTFDEFGMWLHLNTDYWQRASFDAVVAIGSLLGLLATRRHSSSSGPGTGRRPRRSSPRSPYSACCWPIRSVSPGAGSGRISSGSSRTSSPEHGAPSPQRRLVGRRRIPDEAARQHLRVGRQPVVSPVPCPGDVPHGDPARRGR